MPYCIEPERLLVRFKDEELLAGLKRNVQFVQRKYPKFSMNEAVELSLRFTFQAALSQEQIDKLWLLSPKDRLEKAKTSGIKLPNNLKVRRVK
jgi:hypothetical protein